MRNAYMVRDFWLTLQNFALETFSTSDELLANLYLSVCFFDDLQYAAAAKGKYQTTWN